MFTWTAYTTLNVCCLPFDPACRLISSLSAACPDLCIAPVADSALPSLHLLLSLKLACLTSSCLSIKLHLDLTTLTQHYNIYLKRCKSRAAKILKDSNHSGNHLFCLLPSGKRFRSMMAKTERLRRSFFPQAIRLLNTNSVS